MGPILLASLILALGPPQRSAAVARDTVEIHPTPLLEIGGSRTDPEDQLFDVGEVLRSPAGQILVVETAGSRIRVYAPDGTHLTDLGRPGEGPGEFRRIEDVALADQSLLVLDNDGTVTRLSLSGEVLETWRVSIHGVVDERYNPLPSRALADGRVVIRARERIFGRPDGEHMRHAGFLTVDRARHVDTLAFVPSELMLSEDGTPRPFRPWIEASSHGDADRLWISVPHEGVVRRVDAWELTATPPWKPGEPSREHLRAFRDQYVSRGRSANDRRVIGEWIDGSPVAEALPPFRDVVVGTHGRVWLERWPEPGAGSLWSVHGQNGERICLVSSGTPLRLRAAGRDWILGVQADSLGVERVVLHRWSGCEGVTNREDAASP